MPKPPILPAPASPAPPSAPAGPLVVVLAYDGLCTFEFGCAYEIFGLARPEFGADWYRYAVAAVDEGPLRANGGLIVTVDGDLSLVEAADLVVIPGWRGVETPVPERLIASLRAANARGARIASYCSAAFVLGEAGLLDGRGATTHWRYTDRLARRFPLARVAPDVLYVDNGRILTSAGSASAIDMSLHVVRGDYGAGIANSVARRLVLPAHRDGGQAQYIERPVPRAHESERLGEVLDFIRAELHRDLPLAELAARAGMSLRTFQRRFEAMTGEAPGAFVLAERVARARDLLETAAEPGTEEIAARCGFGSAAALRHHFKRRVGVSPGAYRRRFARSR